MRHAVILAGGRGERFWPLSRSDRPKQFLPLGDGDRSLLRATFERLGPLVPAERTWVVTNRDQSAAVRRELPEVPRSQILAEPVGRNTAPAVALAALAVERRDPEAVLVTVPADAWVPRAAPYRRALGAALRAAAADDLLVLVGVIPDRPETGYGYIEPGPAVGRGPARRVRRFVEKPDLRSARRYARSGRHLWNCGIFAWRARALAAAVEAHLPDLARAFSGLRKGRWGPKTLEAAYRRAPGISVDYGILEPADNVAVVPATFTWDDLGSWRALERLGRGDGFRRGDVYAADAGGSIVWAEAGAVGLVGVEDVIVVHTPDATLVVAKDRAQEVRGLVERMASERRGRKYLESPGGRRRS